MSLLSQIVDPIRSLELERTRFLRPPYPPVAVEMTRKHIVLVRLRRRGRKPPTLEARSIGPMPERGVGTSIFRPNLGASSEISSTMQGLMESSGTKPGRISLILPDNLAKISLVSLPERPTSRRRLQDILRFKLRRSVPFRLEDATLSYQIISGDEGGGVNVLVALMLRAVVEQYEQLLVGLGARPGFVGLCTPSLYNLCRNDLSEAGSDGQDVALLNCTGSYFSLLITRGERVIFFRCKSYAVGADEPGNANGMMEREIASSLSYYQEKLSGAGIGTVFVRSVDYTPEAACEMLGRLGIDRVSVIDPASALTLGEGETIDTEQSQRLAPAVGAAVGMVT